MNISSLPSSAVRAIAASYPAASARSVPEGALGSSNEFDYLTPSDRDLIFHATGQRLEPGFDSHQKGLSIFAETTASDRKRGALSAGQEVSAVYLKALSRQYEDAKLQNPNTENPFSGPVMDRALSYLASRPSAGRLDVNL